MNLVASIKERIENPTQLTLIISIVNIILLYPFINSNIYLAIFFIVGILNLMYVGLFTLQTGVSGFKNNFSTVSTNAMQYVSDIFLTEYKNWNKESRFLPQWLYRLYLSSKAILKWLVIYLSSPSIWQLVADFFSSAQAFVWFLITGILLSTTYGSPDNLFAKSNILLSIVLFSIALIITAISASDLYTKYSAKSDKKLELPREDRINHDNMKSSGLIGVLLCFGILWSSQKITPPIEEDDVISLLQPSAPSKITEYFRNVITIGSSPILYYALNTFSGSIHLHGRTKQLNL